ncbi:Acyl-CoA dehydrogenase related to the alkylation response protein AidB [Mycobacterium rhizamassiliense]|jgi:alkylation response protein AidB-like acyl-CoA dehydrogenase|uniref:Acyl-CoA dehydrogenase related to the alkylation response protein AidB n=2 Tax=Mycobacterium TaxID=1763 RepID=A0A2U3PAJ3_9MYCO|nr:MULTISPECIES: acyl-CoA dehydrogenase family protein [Mycobacterium]SPM34932.1 Acyl-CoA dehydrogenase related to the alkylation response protein AidB [Mycobacterium rhizamassiliense]SPM40761.1 Acyl-CoA dehydrogenase related to the alkylation response protein AidB [Mycobacterium numidiamassiliense]
MTDTISQDDLAELRCSIRDFLAAKSTEQQLRSAMESARGWDPLVWSLLTSQLGVQSMALPVEYGGDGYGFRELRVVLEEMGRALLPSPFFSTVVLASSALLAAGDASVCATYLTRIAAGEITATVAVAESDGLWRTDALDTRAVLAENQWTLSGRKDFVVDGATADVILVVAATEAGPSLFAVGAEAAGLTRAPMTTLDMTRHQATLAFDHTPAVLVGEPGAAGTVVERVLDRAMTALAAEQCGAARACLEAATDYARERTQFGRPIGSFQAVKHKCAEMLVRVSLADAAALEAADAADGAPDAPPLGIAAAVAHSVCSEALMFVASENIQVHGGIGFTWEHPAHLYFRRAKSSQLCFGGPAVYHERVLHAFGI